MEISNFDREKIRSININEFAPRHPFRLLICGRSGCGKTNMLLNLLCRHLYFEKLYLFAREAGQDKYQILREFCQGLDDARQKKLLKQLFRQLKRRKITREEFEDIKEQFENENHTLEVFTDISEAQDLGERIDKNKQNIVVFDDQITARDQQPAEEAFVRFRHKNCSVIYLTQSYFSTPKLIRENCSHYCLFEMPTRREAIELAKTFASGVEFKDFNRLFKEATTPEFGFLTIDTITKNPALKLRSGWDGVLRE